jgi:hypothetical protein
VRRTCAPMTWPADDDDPPKAIATDRLAHNHSSELRVLTSWDQVSELTLLTCRLGLAGFIQRRHRHLPPTLARRGLSQFLENYLEHILFK